MNNQKIIQLQNQEFVLNLSDEDEYYKIEAFANDCAVACMTFKLKRGTCYLNRIEILDPKYSHIGLGTQILKFMEQISYKANCCSVEGKFYPFGELGKHAKDFYLKNGYEIYKEYYETYISKYLTKTNIMEETL